MRKQMITQGKSVVAPWSSSVRLGGEAALWMGRMELSLVNYQRSGLVCPFLRVRNKKPNKKPQQPPVC